MHLASLGAAKSADDSNVGSNSMPSFALSRITSGAILDDFDERVLHLFPLSKVSMQFYRGTIEFLLKIPDFERGIQKVVSIVCFFNLLTLWLCAFVPLCLCVTQNKD